MLWPAVAAAEFMRTMVLPVRKVVRVAPLVCAVVVLYWQGSTVIKIMSTVHADAMPCINHLWWEAGQASREMGGRGGCSKPGE